MERTFDEPGKAAGSLAIVVYSSTVKHGGPINRRKAEGEDETGNAGDCLAIEAEL
jgi:hypothetical protein